MTEEGHPMGARKIHRNRIMIKEIRSSLSIGVKVTTIESEYCADEVDRSTDQAERAHLLGEVQLGIRRSGE